MTTNRSAESRLMELTPGMSIGQYQLVKPAGAGGMAEVWRAFDPRLERFVAIKFLSPRLSNAPSYTDRFLREARAVSRLDHPNILTVLDFGEQDGWTYMVSPFIGGGTLSDRLQRGTWTVAEAVAVLDPLAAALDHAHANGIVHRDVKPSNVLFNDQGRLVLGDFGVARILEGTTMLSQAGLVIGTPMYMSPEQADARPVGAASDLYSLGVVAYQMLTGRPPFMAETPLALLRAHIDKPLPPPRDLNPHMPDAVEAALVKIMAKDPAERYGSGGAFLEALRGDVVARPAVWSVPGIESPTRSTGATRIPTPPLSTVTLKPPGPNRKPSVSADGVERASRRRALVGIGAVALGVAGVGVFAWKDGWTIARSSSAAVATAPELAPTVSPTSAPSTVQSTQPPAVTQAPAVEPTSPVAAQIAPTVGPTTAPVVATATTPPSLSTPTTAVTPETSALGAAQPGATAPPAGPPVLASGPATAPGERDLLRVMESHPAGISSLAFSPDNALLATGARDGSARLWQVDGGALVRRLGTGMGEVYGVAFAPDGQLLATASNDKVVRLWQVAEGGLARELSGHADEASDVAFSPDGQLLVSGSVDKTVRLWNVADGSLVREWTGPTEAVLRVAFSPDGQTVGAASADGTIRLWRVGDGGPGRILVGHGGPVTTVRFSPDGQYIASGANDDAVRIWRVDNGTLVRRLDGHTDAIFHLAYSPDGKRLATVSADRTVRLWQAPSGRPLQTLNGHLDLVLGVAFSSDNRLLASGSYDTTVRLWQLR